MKKYVLILSVSALLLITNNAYSLYDLTLATQTVTDCANSAQDGSTGGAGLFTISPTACQRIKLTIDQKAAQLLIIREGIDGLGSIIYNGTAVTLVDSILYTNYGITSVTIEFDHANASAGNEYLITWQGQFASDGASTNNECFGDINGTAQLFPTGGTAGYTYSWTPAGATRKIENLPIGTYTVTATDANGCKFDTSYTITQNPEISSTIDQTKISCFGLNDGEATVNPTGGTGAFTYIWDNGKGTAATATGLAPATTYNITITDANHTSCFITKNITVTENPEFTATISDTKKSCFGASDATALVTVSPTNDGSGVISSYLWSNGSTIATASGLAESTAYTCTVTDSEDCTAIIPAFSTTAQNSKINASIAETQKDCFGGGNDGEAQISASGGTPTLGYLWSSGSATTTESGLAAATFYDCTVTDNIGCNATFTITTSAINPEITATINETKKDCFDGADDGTAEISALGGVAPLTYLWSTGSITTGATG
ncbi:MAG: SprB repeat-containing protein, partial [Salinivirgaceae bacterium]